MSVKQLLLTEDLRGKQNEKERGGVYIHACIQTLAFPYLMSAEVLSNENHRVVFFSVLFILLLSVCACVCVYTNIYYFFYFCLLFSALRVSSILQPNC